MESRLTEVLQGKGGNYLIPFFWQNGGGDELIREEMDAIEASGIREVCVESRVHPDFLGDGWWHTMDVILEEAKKRSMRVWILDDAHFPTGYANGRVEDHPYAGKRYLDCSHIDVPGPLWGSSFLLRLEEQEELAAVTVCRKDDSFLDVTTRVRDGILYWDVPEGIWTINIIKVTEKGTGRKGYINTIDHKAVGLLLETVYQPHYERYGALFGNVLAGFFSDEPEIGNVLSEYGHNARIGISGETLPWSPELEALLKEKFGASYALGLTALWQQIPGVSQKARYQFMEAVTDLYGKNFSGQIGDWCRSHGVEYIGHVIEDNGCHARLGLGTGHFFKAVSGQDMSGIDVVLQQIRPGLSEGDFISIGGKGTYDGRFFHYGLAKLGVSVAYLDEKKGGRTMCEIFGAYGWGEGLKLMKWLADHMLVRGVNTFVPHAFSMKDFPDRDCPPHFYARGKNPQFPYFKYLCDYMNRISHLLQGGEPVMEAAVFYPACSEWMGDCDGFEVPGRALLRHQMDYLVLPEGALLSSEVKDGRLFVDRNAADGGGGEGKPWEFNLLVFPWCEFLPDEILSWCDEAYKKGLRIIMEKRAPRRMGDGTVYQNPMLEVTEDLSQLLDRERPGELKMDRAYPSLRYYHYRQEEEEYYLFFNETVAETVDAWVTLPSVSLGTADSAGALRSEKGVCPCIAGYDAFDNKLYQPILSKGRLKLNLVPGEAALFWVGNREILEDAGLELRDVDLDFMEAGLRLKLTDSGSTEGSPEPHTVYVCNGEWRLKRIGYEGQEQSWESLNASWEDTSRENSGKSPGNSSGESSGESWENSSGAFENLTDWRKTPDFCGKMIYEFRFDGRSSGLYQNKETDFYQNKDVGSSGTKRFLLDCGSIYETLSVWLNGKHLGVRIAPPYRLQAAQEDILPGENLLQIQVCNTLVHSVRDDMSATMPVEPSGLLGPVQFLR